MTTQEIKDRAPDGATYYHDVHGRMIRYVKFENGQPYYWDNWLKIWLCYNIPYELKPL